MTVGGGDVRGFIVFGRRYHRLRLKATRPDRLDTLCGNVALTKAQILASTEVRGTATAYLENWLEHMDTLPLCGHCRRSPALYRHTGTSADWLAAQKEMLAMLAGLTDDG